MVFILGPSTDGDQVRPFLADRVYRCHSGFGLHYIAPPSATGPAIEKDFWFRSPSTCFQRRVACSGISTWMRTPYSLDIDGLPAFFAVHYYVVIRR